MHRITALLSIALLAGCATDRKPPSLASGPVTIQGFDANNRPTVTSYAGRTSAGGGQLSDTTEAGIIAELAKHIGPDIELGYAHILKTDVVQPNVETVEKLENDHKDALALVAKAAAAGATKDLDAAQEVAKIAGKKLAERISGPKQGPQPDSGANSARVYIMGKNAGQHTVDAVSQYRAGYEAKQARADYGSTISTKTKEGTTAADIDAVTSAMREARLAAQPIAPPVVAPPIVFPPIDPPATTNAPNPMLPLPGDFPPVGTNATETIFLPGLPR